MQPRHIQHVEETATVEDKNGRTETCLNRAVAPYNFVELPDTAIQVKPKDLRNADRYYPDLLTGRIVCTLTTESPLYTRSGWQSPEEFAEYGDKAFHELPDDIKQQRAYFFINPATQMPVIPGSSLRGMLRTLVEIASFSKIDRVSDHQRLFFRAVGSNPEKESWGKEYKDYVNPKIIKAGYLVRDGENWSIQPAIKREGKTYAWAKEDSLDSETLGLKKFDTEHQYEPQYISVSYTKAEVNKTDRANRLFAHDVDLSEKYPLKGKLVTSGNMKQGDESSPRRNHCIVFPINENAEPLTIDSQAIEHYRNALTDFQKSSPFKKDWGFLEENRPIFYYHDGKSKTIGFFGQSPNFRIPYSPNGNGHATTVVDFIPESLRTSATIDLADAIFGWIKKESSSECLSEDFDKQKSGRVCIMDALYKNSTNGIWYQDEAITPQVLSEPKPTYFPHYLVQSKTGKIDLNHYATTPVENTVIRGHKLYWHKGIDPDFKLPKPKKVIDSSKKVSIAQDSKQTTLIRPLKKGVTFKFQIHFENLSSIELGALLWVLKVAQDDRYRLSLGMGKPLGMGAVKIEHQVYLSDRDNIKGRYSKLFTNSKDVQWHIVEHNADDQREDWISQFEQYILDNISDFDHPKQGKANCLEDLPRIQMLLAMLSWKEKLTQDELDERRYMEIERDKSESHIIGKPVKPSDKTVNEYKERPVLPTPLQVIDWPDNRQSFQSPKQIKPDQTSNKITSKAQQVRQAKISQLLESETLEVGKQLEATILGKKSKGSEVTYDILGIKFKEKEKREFSNIPDSGTVVVEIKSLREDGSIKHIKFVRKVD